MGNNFANDFNHKLFVAFELINREYDNSLKLKLNHIFVAILVSAEHFTLFLVQYLFTLNDVLWIQWIPYLHTKVELDNKLVEA